jgi:hypothetical protein
MKSFGHYLIGSAATFFYVMIISPVTMGDVVGGKQHREGELSAESYEQFTFEFEKNKDCMIKATFAPKNIRERAKEECEKLSMKMWVDGEWFQTGFGRLIYVEDASGKETLTCVIDPMGYSYGHPTAKRNRNVTVRLVNGNIWKALYVLDTN